MVLVANLLVELGASMILLGCYTEAESCVGEGTPCWEGEPAGCTRRTVCDTDTEIDMEEDEAGCRKCQKPCSEKIYIMYSSRKDITPASGWYTYQSNMFTRMLPEHQIFFSLEKNWSLTEFKDSQEHLITNRIKLTYKNDTRTRIALHNFGIDENELKTLNVYTKPKKLKRKFGTPYTEKLVIFCPGKCLCREFHVKSILNDCFNGVYRRVDKNTTTVQPKQESSADSQSTRKKRSYGPQSRAKRGASVLTTADIINSIVIPNFDPTIDFSFTPNTVQNYQRFTANTVQNDQRFTANTVQNDQHFTDNTVQNDHRFTANTVQTDQRFTPNIVQNDQHFTANTVQNDQHFTANTVQNDQHFTYNTVQNDQHFTPNTVQNDQPPPMETSKKSPKKTKPNNTPAPETTPNEEENQNWQQETYAKLTSGDPSDEPFEFTYDEDFQVWFIGKGDKISAVIPEASPCPEMIQKQPWLIIEKDNQLNLSKANTSIICRQRG